MVASWRMAPEGGEEEAVVVVCWLCEGRPGLGASAWEGARVVEGERVL